MGGIVGGQKPPSTGPSQAEIQAQQQLEAQQKAEEQKREQLRISLAKQRFGGAGSAAQANIGPSNGSLLG